jgi:O-antigen ligase
MRWRCASNLLAFAAFGGPMLLALNAPPSPTLLSQCIAIALQGAWVALQGRTGTLPGVGRGAGVLVAAVAAYGLALVPAMAAGLPATIALGLLGVLLAAMHVSFAASADAPAAHSVASLRCLGFALAAAGLLSALIACVQVFAPGLPDGNLVARSTLPGRAVGNLRQPNHLSSLLLWSLICGVLLLELRAWTWRVVAALCAALVFGLVLSGSRTGALGTLLLATWGLSDRRLSRGSRGILVALPVLTLLIWLCLSAWAHITGQAFAAETRLVPGNGDFSSSRFAIWSNALTMIARNPWTGVGCGEFNFAWTLSAFPNRPTAFFDHTHNLPLQLLVELGIPLGTLVVGLLVAALVWAGRNAWAHEGAEGVARRVAFMLVLMIGLHSMLEYPLWYAYFLLPTAFAWGFALSRSTSPDTTPAVATAASLTSRLLFGRRAMAFAGLAMSIGVAFAVLEYRHIVVIYDPPDDAAPLEDRIARGQRSPLFGHHADYAAATAFGPPKAPLSPSQELAFKRAPHQLLDVRLMIAWSQALAAQGDLDKARWLAARIREFRNPGADEYFAPCSDSAQAAQAFQCQPPTREVHWREFTQR